MSNTLTAVMYEILGRALPVLRESAWAPQVVSRDFQPQTAEKGDTIDVWTYPDSTPYNVTPSESPLAPQDTTPSKIQLTLDQWKGDNFHMTDKEMFEIANQANFVPSVLSSKVKGLANAVNESVLNLYTEFYGYVGTAGTTPFSNATDRTAAKDGSRVAAKLTQQLAPRGNRYCFLDEDAVAEATALPQFSHAEKRGNNNVIEDATVGNQYGVTWLHEHYSPTHTAGTITTGLIAKAATGVAAGLKTFVGTTAASTGACALVVGDIINIAGHNQTYVLTAAATQASAASDVTLAFEPGLEFALVGSEAVTVKATHTVNLAIHRNAIVLASRMLERDTGNPTAVVNDPVTGLTMRLERVRQRKQTMWELDILWGVKVHRREFGVRLAG